MLKSFSKDLFKYIPSKIVPVFLSFIAIPIFARLLGPELFGVYSIVVTTIGILLILSGWLNMAIIRFYPAVTKQDAPELLRSVVFTKIISALFFALLGYLVSQYYWPGETKFQTWLALGLVVSVLQGLYFLLADILRVRSRVGAYSFFVISERMVSVVTGLLFVLIWNVEGLGILLGMCIGSIFFLPWLWRKALEGIRSFGSISFKFIQRLAWYGIPLAVGNFGAWILSQSDRYLIAKFYTASDVGIYSAAYTISENSVMLIGNLFILASGPMMVNVWENRGKEVTKELFTNVTRLYLLVAIPAAAGLSILSVPIIVVLMGSEYLEGAYIIPWVAIGALFLGLQHRFNTSLTLVHRTLDVMVIMLISGILNVSLNLLLLPSTNYFIAAVNTSISYAFLCFLLAFWSRKYFSWPFPWGSFFRILMATIVMCISLYILGSFIPQKPLIELLVLIPIGIIIYILTIVVIGEITPSERYAILRRARMFFKIPI